MDGRDLTEIIRPFPVAHGHGIPRTHPQGPADMPGVRSIQRALPSGPKAAEERKNRGMALLLSVLRRESGQGPDNFPSPNQTRPSSRAVRAVQSRGSGCVTMGPFP